ncbi:DUF3301 domain-containing protein [Arsukibacterium sp.]|uniref:DUF3301 domain-containing protein n=1 Tax=Arsukibacterium sp. TaxID=1977258 RepID=UPI002FDB505C
MTSVWLILLLVSIMYLFWLQRKQDERALLLARQLCKQQELQLLDCGRNRHCWRKQSGKWRWLTLYQVDFSADGESRYQAELLLSGLRLAAFNLPPHRI